MEVRAIRAHFTFTKYKAYESNRKDNTLFVCMSHLSLEYFLDISARIIHTTIQNYCDKNVRPRCIQNDKFCISSNTLLCVLYNFNILGSQMRPTHTNKQTHFTYVHKTILANFQANKIQWIETFCTFSIEHMFYMLGMLGVFA